MDIPSMRPVRVADEDDRSHGQRVFAAAVDWLFHILVMPPVILLLWSFSGPGVPMLSTAFALLLLAAFCIAWLVRLIVHSAKDRPRFGPFLVAPLIVVVAVVLIASGVPRQARWALSRGAFDAVATQLQANPEATTPERIGLYSVGQPQRVPGGWIIYEASGNGFIDDAGFAYLPAGPTSDLGNGAWEGPQFRPLGGPWYSWTASW